MGYDMGDACPLKMQSAAWIPVQMDQEIAALVLYPRGAKGWNRYEMHFTSALTRAVEPLFKMRQMERSHQQTRALMQEQRDELLREMHDGLGSQLFGASLLSDVSENMTEAELRKRLGDVSATLSDAMDSLRTGLTLLSTPPEAFGPAVLSLLMRAERVLGAGGIGLQTRMDDDTVSLHLDSRRVFGILRAMQEGLTNIARHSKASHAVVQLTLQENSLAILIQDDGVGFILGATRSGHGLASMTRRLQMLDGCANIITAPSAGCTIELSLPLRIGAL